MDPLQNYFQGWGGGMFLGFGMVVALAALAWTLYWKGRALWKAAQAGEKGWFIALLLINTLGILEIAYIYYFSKRKNATPTQ